MNSLKNSVVTVVLLAVGYGAYVVMNSPPEHSLDDLGGDDAWTTDASPDLQIESNSQPSGNQLAESTPPFPQFSNGAPNFAAQDNSVPAFSAPSNSTTNDWNQNALSEPINQGVQQVEQFAADAGQFIQQKTEEFSGGAGDFADSARDFAANGVDQLAGQFEEQTQQLAESAGQIVDDAKNRFSEAASGLVGNAQETIQDFGNNLPEQARQSVENLTDSASSYYAATANAVNQATENLTETASDAVENFGQATAPTTESGYPNTGYPAMQYVDPQSANSYQPPSGVDNGFEASWQAVAQSAQQDKLAEALFTLSMWYSNPTLSNDQRTRCTQLLDQLSGTVIYSNKSHLEPVYNVQVGDTLPIISDRFSVPYQFLARINNLDPSKPLRVGQPLKVVRGPFRAEVNVVQGTMTVFLGRYYAGRFAIQVGPDLPRQDAIYEVAEKTNGKDFFDKRIGRTIEKGDQQNPYGSYWIGLRGDEVTTAHNVGIHPRVVDDPNIGAIMLSPTDVSDLGAILSVGSRITIRR